VSGARGEIYRGMGVRRQASGAFRSGDQPQTPEARRHWLPAAIVILAALAPPAFACPVCWGAPDDPMVKGVNSGIWVLLGLVALVQIGFVAMFYSFWRKAREQRRFRESLRVIEGGTHP
jgi:hypothetical protein